MGDVTYNSTGGILSTHLEKLEKLDYFHSETTTVVSSQASADNGVKLEFSRPVIFAKI